MAMIRQETLIGASAERCFDLSRDLDLHVRSMAHSGERAVAGRLSGLLGPGEEVTWEGRHFGLMLRHSSRITEYDRPRYFRDSMVRGMFARFEHDHYFESVASGTLMRDVVEFASPLGLLGRFVDRVVLKRHLERLIATRAQAIKREAEADERLNGRGDR